MLNNVTYARCLQVNGHVLKGWSTISVSFYMLLLSNKEGEAEYPNNQSECKGICVD